MQKELFRPALHFSPAEKWINDPNGLVYYKGEYHLFYQYHPESTVWGPMHWGHAISSDLVNWEELPVALYPDELGQIFSGSAVVDWHNTSGFQTGEEAVLVAVFTHHGDDNEKQSIAYSNDRGRTWSKYSGNPVIQNPGIKDFRDPKVFWHEVSQKWIMSLACGDHIQFYGSANLKEWIYLSSFGETYGAHGGVWECPDLIRLNTDSEQKWVLIVSLNPGGPNGGSAIQYFTGDFDGNVFLSDQKEEEEKWADWGRDFYAAVTWSDLEEPTWIGWMSNWQYANQTPTENFRGSMSLARTLSLENRNGQYYLIQKPVFPDQEKLKTILKTNELILGASSYKASVLQDCSIIVEMDISSFEAEGWSMQMEGDSARITMAFDAKAKTFIVDRTKSGMTDFSSHFPSVDSMPLDYLRNVSLVLDRASIELFVNDGCAVMTESIYAPDGIQSIEFKAEKGEVVVESLTISAVLE
ncbi:glycoside hydrolase family 32 protein [Domibacillus enclensis]|uniref:Fructan beta-fructosidase n=1 Tax=Domibacillus enclensis TaxID=1017273 RepID=A0A1N6V6N7_9BACI|nr:glycoside hydrolase family 32 protein [Domibacillus enclensis]OXS78711.1 hypothetical protein B1B05_08970 [Domibacillus enclensis]SIQ73505.1 fructan beta-fructosidase [Domibacillus enclensis]